MTSVAWVLAAAMSTTAVAPEIINGTVDDGDPAVVMLALEMPGAAPQPLCTGTVISPHVVLTAAHCVAPSSIGTSAVILVFAGSKLDASVTPDQLLGVAAVHWVDTFVYSEASGSDTDDLGVVVLRERTTIAPLPFNHFALARGANGAVGRIVGYGITSANDNAGLTAGTRRQAPIDLFSINEDETLTVYDKAHSICFGDSGGPSLFALDGTEQIAGVSREVYLGCPVNMGASDTRTDAFADVIDGWIADADGPLPLGGGACASNSDCAPFLCGDTSAGRICERPCDPHSPSTACAPGTVCREVDKKTMCAPPAPRHGCAIGGDDAGGGLVAWLVVALLAVDKRRRRVVTREHADSRGAA